MEEIALDITPITSSESSDASREEEKWTDRHEKFLRLLRERAENQACIHERAYKYTKAASFFIHIPTTCLPVLAALVNQTGVSPLTSTILMGTSALVSAVGGILNYQKRAQQHHQYAGLYQELAVTIRYTLARKKRSRSACDVTVQKLMFRMQTIEAGSPPTYA